MLGLEDDAGKRREGKSRSGVDGRSLGRRSCAPPRQTPSHSSRGVWMNGGANSGVSGRAPKTRGGRSRGMSRSRSKGKGGI